MITPTCNTPGPMFSPMVSPTDNFRIIEVTGGTPVESLDSKMLAGAIKVYQTAFAQPPYCEDYTPEAVKDVFKEILVENRGDLLLGVDGNEVISLTAGYAKGKLYYIAELAVNPLIQGKKFGRRTYQALETLVNDKGFPGMYLRTGADEKTNFRALNLYRSAGFTVELGQEMVPQLRQDHRIGLDPRVYMSKPSLSDEARLKILKHLGVVTTSDSTTAIIFDNFPKDKVDHEKLFKNIMHFFAEQHPDANEIKHCCCVTMPVSDESIARIELFDRGSCTSDVIGSAIWMLTNGKDYDGQSQIGKDYTGQIEVSGISQPIAFHVLDGEVFFKMPSPTQDNPNQTSEIHVRPTILYNKEFSMA